MSFEFVDRLMEQNKTGELRSPVSQTMDMHLVEFGRGEAVYEMPAREELGNPLGVIQGGVATALADAAMAAATTTILNDEEIQKSAITTIDIFARFIRPVNAKKVERLRAEAKVVRAGGNSGCTFRRRDDRAPARRRSARCYARWRCTRGFRTHGTPSPR